MIAGLAYNRFPQINTFSNAAWAEERYFTEHSTYTFKASDLVAAGFQQSPDIFLYIPSDYVRYQRQTLDN